MKRLHLWLLRWRAVHLEADVLRGEALLRETRARLIEAHRSLRQIRSKIAEATPADELMAEAMKRRDAELARRSSFAWGGNSRRAGVASPLSRR